MKQSIKKALDHIASFLLRYGLAVAFIWLGYLKFKHIEIENSSNIISHTSYIGWLFKHVSTNVASMAIAYLQITIGILLALKPLSPKASTWGGFMAFFVMLFNVVTLITSGALMQSGGFPALSGVGQVLLRDVILLGASAWCTSDTL